jgi:hypothetical protein
MWAIRFDYPHEMPGAPLPVILCAFRFLCICFFPCICRSPQLPADLLSLGKPPATRNRTFLKKESLQPIKRILWGASPRIAGEFPRTAGEFPRTAGEFPRTAGEFPRIAGTSSEGKKRTIPQKSFSIILCAT